MQTIHNTVHLREDPYTRVLNSMINDERLTFKARGLLMFMLAKPKDWKTRVGWIESKTPEGREAIRGAIEELEKLGYLRREQTKDGVGQFSSFAYHWYDFPAIQPEDGKPSYGEESVDSRSTGSRSTGSRPLQTKEEETKDNKDMGDRSELRPAPEPFSEQDPDMIEIGKMLRDPKFLIQTAVHKWFKRRANTKWSKIEDKSLAELAKAYATVPLDELREDLDILEWYYTVSGCEFLRRDVKTLLNNWQGEIDRAKEYK
jgi:hypothetical protein